MALSSLSNPVSTISEDILPPHISKIKWMALKKAISHNSGFKFFSNLNVAWLFRSKWLAVFLLLPPSKHADSRTILEVSDCIPDSLPPYIPAKATGKSESAITSISSLSSLFSSSRVINLSPFLAFLTTILLLFIFL